MSTLLWGLEGGRVVWGSDEAQTLLPDVDEGLEGLAGLIGCWCWVRELQQRMKLDVSQYITFVNSAYFIDSLPCTEFTKDTEQILEILMLKIIYKLVSFSSFL